MLAQAQLDKEQFLWTDGAVRIVFSVMILIGFLYLTCIHVSFCLAQVAPAITPTSGVGDLGTIVTSSGNVHTITGGTRPAGEGNLFHSFAEFGVLTNITANFLNETLTPTSNILVRVTGGNISNIFGTIQTTDFGTANLFLMNPAGFLFGPTAAVNVGGMVAFTSADYLRLTDNSRFNAIPSAAADALLSRTPVAAFGFLGSNPGAITVQGSQLAVDTGQTLSLIGGNITLKAAELLAPRGQINLASIPSSGEIPSQIANLSPITNGSGATGTIQVSDQSVLDVSDGGGGTVTIRGGRFVLSDSMIFANVLGPAEATPGKGIDIAVAQDAVIQNGSILDTSIFADATPGVKYGGVTIRADRIEILRAQGASETAIFSDVLGSAGGDSGDILLTAGSILMRGTETSRPRLSAGTEESAGNAGKITLDTIGNLEIDRGTIISNVFLSSGDAGNIALSSAYGDILMTRAIVTSQTDQGKGNTGNIKVSAPEGDILLGDTSQLFTATRGTGAGGQLDIIANNLEMTGGSSITDDNLGSIQPGSVNVTLSGKLTLRGGSRIEPVSRSFVGAPAADFNITAKDILITGAGSKLSSETFRAGQGGNLNILSETVQLTNGGQIRSGSTIQPVPPAPQREIPTGAGGTITIQGLSSPATSVLIDGAGSGIFTTAEGTGAGGTIHLSTQALTLQNGGAISAATSGSAPSATGGTIVISATDQVTITSGGSISASSTGPGNAGNIKINAGQQFEMRDSSITTQATRASGGNIDIQAVDLIRMVNSEISSSVQGGASTAGGNITIDPNVVVLQNSKVKADAVLGSGGNITIFTPLFLADPSSELSASSQKGINGTVTIQSPTSNLSGSLGPLTSKPSQTQALLTQRCAALASGQASSFVVAGREQLPADPGGWLSSPLAFAALGENLDADHAIASAPAIMTMATRDTDTISLRRLTPAGFLMANFAESEATGCRS